MAYGGAVTMHTLAALAFIGSLFYYADEARWVTDTIISDSTAIAGYDCAPLSPDEFYGLNYTYEECLTKIVPLTESAIGFDIANAEAIAAGGYLTRTDYSNGGTIPYNCSGRNSVYYNPFGSVQAHRGIWPKLPESRTPEIETYINQVVNNGDCRQDPPYPSGVTCNAGQIRRSGGGSTNGIVGDCETFNTSAAHFLQLFNKTIEYVNGGDVCEFTKHNLPYKCLKSKRMTALEMIGLSNNNAGLVITVFLATLPTFIGFFRKAPKATNEKTWIEKLSFPPEFYDEEPLEFVSNTLVVGFFSLTICAVGVGTFAWFYQYFSSTSQYITDIQITGSWAMPGYNCTPLTTDNLGYGVRYTFDDCKAALQDITVDNINFDPWQGDPSNMPNPVPIKAKYVPFNASKEGVSSQAFWGKERPNATLTQYSATTDLDHWEDPASFLVGGKPQSTRILINAPSNSWTDALKADAVEVWKAMMDVAGDEVCLFTKENSPYECKKSGPPDTLTRLSLSYGNAQFIAASLMWIVAIIIKRLPASNPLGWKARLPMEDKWFRVTDLDLVMSPIRTLLVCFVLGAASLIVFALLLQFYATQEFTETVVENVLEKEGFTCRPLKDAIWYGKNWTYDECLAKIEEPSLTNSGLSELEQSTPSWGPGQGILSYSDADYGRQPSAYLRPWGRFGPSYKYYANMMGTVNATFDTFFQNQQTNFTNHISGTVHGSLILTTDEYKAGGIAVSYTAVMDRNDALVLNTFRTIFDEIGRDRMCAWTKENFPYSCTRKYKLPPLQVLSQAGGNAAFFFLLVSIASVELLAIVKTRRVTVENLLAFS